MIRGIDRTDLAILASLKFEDASGVFTLDKPTEGLTITEIREYLESIRSNKSRKTIYLHLQRLVENGYLKKGVMDNHAHTYYLTDNGKIAMKGEL